MRAVSEVRPSPISGTWYSSDPTQLTQEIDRYLHQDPLTGLAGKIKGILVPHAGYRYSGSTAGRAFQQINGLDFDLVIVLSPFHAFHHGSILTSQHQKYETPLGNIEIDQDLVKNLENQLKIQLEIDLEYVANDQEHSLEIELPFLQQALTAPFSLLPLMTRLVDPQAAKQIAIVVFDLIKNRKCLVVISTDLSHFYPQQIAEKLDQTMLDSVASFSSESVFRTEQEGKGFACGLGAILIGIELTKLMGADKVEIIAHSTSAEQTADWSSVVGYGAAAILSSHESGK